MSYALVGSLLLGAAWHFPGAWLAVLLGGTGITLILASSKRISFKELWFCGAVLYATGHYWLFSTIQSFSGLPSVASFFVFILFIGASGLHLPVAAMVIQRLSPYRLAFAVGFFATTEIFPRLFPWEIGHLLLPTPLSQVADLGGVQLVSLIFLIGVTPLITWTRPRVWEIGIVSLALGYGVLRPDLLPLETATTKLALVQAKISTEEKHQVTLFLENTEKYRQLSAQIPDDTGLIIWPESVIQHFIHVSTSDRRFDPRIDPILPMKPTLFGALSFSSPEKIYNSAFLSHSGGRIEPPYHKRILMPFGEFTPFASTFPWLRELNASVGDFTAGVGSKTWTLAGVSKSLISDNTPAVSLKISPLICYEDIIPRLAAEAQQPSALIAIANDAWFGDTIAPMQHHLIASYRAIERRVPLVRSTNTGVTAIVDRLGRTTYSIPQFSEGVLLGEIKTTDGYAPVPLLRTWHWVGLALIAIIIAAVRAKRTTTATESLNE